MKKLIASEPPKRKQALNIIWQIFIWLKGLLIHMGILRIRMGKYDLNVLLNKLGFRLIPPFEEEIEVSLAITRQKIFLPPRYKDGRILIYGFAPGKELSLLIPRLIKKGMTVVDAGANLGYFSLLFSRFVGTSGKVYALFLPCKEYQN